MMAGKNLKITFFTLAIAMLIAMLVISRDAGISGDEEVHYKQSEFVYSYFKTMGKDQSALYTPETHLQYYGQAFDNLVTILTHWFNIRDVYGFRHLMCSISGWLTILVTGLFAVYISGYGAGILVLLLFAISPTFLGHAQNNLKDIPFALAYISSLYYSIRLVFSENKLLWKDITLLILSIGLSVGIRAGGILVIFYLGLFLILKVASEVIRNKKFDINQFMRRAIICGGIALAGYLLGLVLWPYGLRNPILHPWKAYEVMTRFPTTVRQIFEGQFDWSDFHPWYYLPKYMALTIPLVVLAGVAVFFLNTKKNYPQETQLQLALVVFSIVFPVLFVLVKQSNLYGSWRHFLFIYPGIVLLAALGIFSLFRQIKSRWQSLLTGGILVVAAVHPLRFMAANHPLYYLYYNEFAGGLKGAYGNYETDYYYHSMRQGAEWLREYLKGNPANDSVIVGGNFPIQWYFRNDKNTTFVYFPWQKRSEYNWDYAIVANSYIPPYQLKNKIWPPQNTIHTVMADGVPVCAVVERLTKDDYLAIAEQNKGNNIKSALLFENAVKFDPQNEWICYKFAEVLLANGNEDQASAMLNQCLQTNPGFEKALILLGDIAMKKNDAKAAAGFYSRTVKANRKYYAAYLKLASVYSETDRAKARKILKDCLRMNNGYKPALVALANTYRESNPEIARKYDEIIKKLK